MTRECMIKKVQKTYCTLWRDLKSHITDVSEEKKMQWYLKRWVNIFAKWWNILSTHSRNSKLKNITWRHIIQNLYLKNNIGVGWFWMQPKKREFIGSILATIIIVEFWKETKLKNIRIFWKMLKIKCQCIILYPAKMSFTMKAEINVFPEK